MVNFKGLLDKATNSELSEPDWETILDIVEEVKQKNVSVKNAVKEIRKKLLDPNSTVVYYILQVLDSVMKNCLCDVHKEILSQEFLGVVKSVITSSRDGRSDRAIDKALELIGEWKAAFGDRAGYKAVNEVFGELEREGFYIPEPQVASAAFVKQAPEWVMGDRCHMCRQEFNRLKGWFPHHCRNCGKSVCTQCSTKRIPLPEFGIKQPTRVCDICYKNVAPDSSSEPASKSKGAGESAGDLPQEYLRSSLAKEPQVAPAVRSDERKLQEEDDLQLAIAMSLNEQDNKKKTTSSSKHVSSPAPPPTSTAPSAPPFSTPSLYSSIAQEAANTAAASSTLYSVPAVQPEQPPQPTTSSTDPNLARYLDRGYWERRRDQQASGVGVAPGGVSQPPQTGPVSAAPAGSVAGGKASGSPLANTVRSTVEQFVRQMQQVSMAGGSVAADPIILSLYQTLNALHPQLLKQIDDVQQQKVREEQLIHKINEAKTARATLNKMRREHQEKIRQQEEEQTLLARMQMEQKLALLRQQKQEQLVYQQSLQQKRLDNMHAKRQEYEQQLATQREQERQQLIVQEQEVLQRHLREGGSRSPVHMQMQVPAQPVQTQYQSVPPPPSMDPTALPLHTLTLHDPTITYQAPPLPTKLDHNIAPDPGPMSLPPPYQPPLPAAPAFHTMPTLQHPPPMQSVYPDPTQPPGSHGDASSLWVNNHTPSLHPPTHLNPSPTSTPPQQHSPMSIAQPLGNTAVPTVQYQPQPVMVTAAGPSQPLQSLPPQQLYQPTTNFGPPHSMDQAMNQLPGQQQPLSMHPQLMAMQGSVAPLGGIQRQESGPPLITFD